MIFTETLYLVYADRTEIRYYWNFSTNSWVNEFEWNCLTPSNVTAYGIAEWLRAYVQECSFSGKIS